MYVTDSLHLAQQNKMISARWIEMIEEKPVDNRTGDEIAMAVIQAAGLKLKGGEES